MNRLFDKGVKVRRVIAGRNRGDFIATGAPTGLLEELAGQTGVDFRSLTETVEAPEIHRLRIGIYQHYRGGSTDEGWTRLGRPNIAAASARMEWPP
jgi:hypothetical protein